jgi:DNA-binding response OmpR family regulator
MSYRLLVIEDSATQLLAIKKTLEAEGYTIFEARNAAEGLARAYSALPDLIISDVVMSGISGYQLCRLVKNDTELANVPVILLTKLDGSVDRFWGLKSGADRYIPKEPGFPSLIRAVRELLAESKLHPLKAVNDPNRTPTAEEINSRLHQLLDRLLFEATIVDEVRRIGEDILDIELIAEKLFALLGSVLNYWAAALVVNQTSHSTMLLDVTTSESEEDVRAYVSRLSAQLGLPSFREKECQSFTEVENALTQSIDMRGQRLGLLVVVPPRKQVFKPGDQKVVRLIAEQLSIVLRLYLSHTDRLAGPVTAAS